MSHYFSTVLSYLEHYQQERFARLKSQRRLAEVVEVLVGRIYEEEARQFALLQSYHPDSSEAQLRLTAGHIAVDAVLPTPELEVISEGGQHHE